MWHLTITGEYRMLACRLQYNAHEATTWSLTSWSCQTHRSKQVEARRAGGGKV